jgi:hypothetical protein
LYIGLFIFRSHLLSHLAADRSISAANDEFRRKTLKRIALGAAALFGVFFVVPDQASARFSPHAVAAPSLTENVACTTRRVRTVRPNGRVVFRDVRTCTPECRMVRERTRLPNGNVIIRNVRRCR